MRKETLATALSMIDERHIAYVTDKEAGKIFTATSNSSGSEDMPAFIRGTKADTVKNILSTAACIVLAVAVVIAFILMRNSISTPSDTDTDTDTNTEDAVEIESESETETETEMEMETETETETETEVETEDEEDLIVAPEGHQVVWLCTSVDYVNDLFDQHGQWRYEYDEAGMLLTVNDDYKLFYENGELIKIMHDEGRFTEYTFENGKIINEYTINDSAFNTTYIYDDHGYLIRSEQYCFTMGETEYIIEYTYDENGYLMSEIANGYGSFQYHYEYKNDVNGRVTEKRSYDENGELLSYNMYAYDEKNNLIEDAEYSADGSVSVIYDHAYTYGEDGRILFWIDRAGSSIAFTYDGHGNCIKQTISSQSDYYEYTYEAFILRDEDVEKNRIAEELYSEYVPLNIGFYNAVGSQYS